MRPVAARTGKVPAQLSIAWVLRRPEVTSAIVGARRPAQIEETVAAGDWTLSAQDISDLDALLAVRAAS
jgi:aryl-alcohol dehydrogenase-like predicted oxidoreductase